MQVFSVEHKIEANSTKSLVVITTRIELKNICSRIKCKLNVQVLLVCLQQNMSEELLTKRMMSVLHLFATYI